MESTSNKQLQTSNYRIIISGGGTGGHVFPAIAIANELKNKYPGTEILFVGAKDKLEMEKVPKAGYPIKGLWISGFHRKLTMRNLLFPLKLLHSLWKSFWIIRGFKPHAAVGVGGFASGPVLEMANRMGVPTLIQEQNSYAGVTNKLLSKKAHTICVAYDKMDRWFPLEKIVLTGNPVRKDIKKGAAEKDKALAHFGFSKVKKTIFITGGSLGAKTLNEAMAANFDLLKKHDEVQILWQAGKLYIEEFSEMEVARLPNIKITAFVDRMDLAYTMADLIICRAGASTISELCIIGKPAVLIPSPNVAEDHQTQNALALVEKQAAVLVKDSDAKEKMITEAFSVLADENLSRQLGENILQLAKPDAAQRIVEEVIKLVSDR